MLTFNKRGLYMLKIAICDDEQIFIDILKSQLNGIFSQLNADVCIYPFSGAGALINYMDSTYFDVIFLDIDMPEITGFDAAKKVKPDALINNSIVNPYFSEVTDHILCIARIDRQAAVCITDQLRLIQRR